MIGFQIILLILYIKSATLIKNRLLKLIVLFYTILYGLQLVFSIWDPYKMMPIDLYTIVLFNLQLIFFQVGVHPIRNINDDRTNDLHNRRKIDSFSWPRIRVNWILLLSVSVELAYSFYNYHRMQEYVLTLNMAKEGREYYYSTFFPSYSMVIINYIITSFKICSIFISFTLLFSSKKIKLKEGFVIGGTFLSLFFEAMTSMGRGDILYILIIYILFCMICSVYFAKVFRRKILPVSLAIIGIVIFAILATSLIRFNSTTEDLDMELLSGILLEPFCTYFYGPIQAFNYGIDHIFKFSFPFLGAASLAGFWDFILLPFQAVDSYFSKFSMNDALGLVMTPFFNFPGGQDWNALFTGCINYYLDFGALGFIFFPWIHGRLFAKLTSNLNKPLYQLLLTFLFWCSFKHMVSSGIQSVDTIFTLMWIWFVCKKKIVSGNNTDT